MEIVANIVDAPCVLIDDHKRLLFSINVVHLDNLILFFVSNVLGEVFKFVLLACWVFYSDRSTDALVAWCDHCLVGSFP